MRSIWELVRNGGSWPSGAWGWFRQVTVGSRESVSSPSSLGDSNMQSLRVTLSETLPFISYCTCSTYEGTKEKPLLLAVSYFWSLHCYGIVESSQTPLQRFLDRLCLFRKRKNAWKTVTLKCLATGIRPFKIIINFIENILMRIYWMLMKALV